MLFDGRPYLDVCELIFDLGQRVDPVDNKDEWYTSGGLCSPFLWGDDLYDAAFESPTLDLCHVSLKVGKLVHGGLEYGYAAVCEGVVVGVEPWPGVGVWRRWKMGAL